MRDLGITARTFVDALNAGTLGSSETVAFNIPADATLTTFLTTHASKAISFNLTAVHNISGFDPNTFESIDIGFLSTSRDSAAEVAVRKPALVADYADAENAILSFVRGANIRTDGSPVGNAALNLSTTFAPGQFGYHDNNFGGSSTFRFNTEGTLGNAVDFYFLATNNNGPAPLPELLGSWTLQTNGALIFAPVPVPSAVWLLGSALLAVGVRRHGAV